MGDEEWEIESVGLYLSSDIHAKGVVSIIGKDTAARVALVELEKNGASNYDKSDDSRAVKMANYICKLHNDSIANKD